MPDAVFLVCERKGDWAVAWRRALPGVRVHETRSLAENVEELAAHPASVLAVAAEMAAAESLAGWLAEMHARFPQARLVLLADPAGGEIEWLAREAGVVQVIRSRVELSTAAAWITTHLAQFAAAEGNLRERTWAKLPWPRLATAVKFESKTESKT